ncbi:trypsin-like [Leptodactylus fuscus]|uniref:trypsin-like n=1 Tax=Leptodactylus fuscus TaxID=238119 RepID=UPI003F4E9E5C
MRSLVVIAFLVVGAFSKPFEGEAAQRIISGNTCKMKTAPYQVSLRDIAGLHFCGGALIANQWVLTSAQCYKSDFQVVLGEHDITANEGTEQIIDVYRAIRHRFFNPQTLDNDIMLIKLSQQVTINDYVRILSLPTACADANKSCLVSGWGKTSTEDVYYPAYTLQCLESPIVSDSQCANYYSGKITPNMLCAGRAGASTTCKGDEGGPLVCDSQIQGIVSWGNRCDTRNNPWVYTKVCRYVGWIRDTMKQFS